MRRIVGIDLGAAPNQIVDDAISRAAKSTGCPAQNVLISATHTHSSNTQGLGQGPPTAKTVADAIVEAATVAKTRLAPARVGYGTTTIDLNVNRDLFNRKLEWRQEPNPDGASDKTLAIVEFLGGDGVPIGVYMNYAMHPINFYLSGVISADFPGEASRSANVGYIYADAAYSHLTFQVIGSRLKPGCAEGKIVAAAIRLMREAGQ